LGPGSQIKIVARNLLPMDQTDGLDQIIGVEIDGSFSLQPKDLDDGVFTIFFANLWHEELSIDSIHQQDPGADAKDSPTDRLLDSW